MKFGRLIMASFVALALTVMINSAAQATVVDFENYAGQKLQDGNPVVSGGYSFSGGTWAVWYGNPYTDNGTESLVYGNNNNWTEMTQVGGGAFSVTKFDSGLTWYTTEQSFVVALTGTTSDGSTEIDSITLGRGYRTYSFDNLNNLIDLKFSGVPLGYIAVDNIVVSATPLPPTWTMMLIGLAGFGFFAYRRKPTPALMAA